MSANASDVAPAPAVTATAPNGPGHTPVAASVASVMSGFTIRKKITVSFGVLVVLLVAVGVIAFSSLKSNKDKLSILVDDVQPATELSLNLVDQLDRASASLGFYLLSKEEVHKNDYIGNLTKITESVESLAGMKIVREDPNTLKLVEDVQQGIGKLQGYKDRMLVFASDDSKNTPALGFAAREVNPRAQVMLQSLQEIILAEGNETPSAERREFLLDIFSLRTNVASALNELRLFLAFRGEGPKENFRSYMDLAIRDAKKINGPSKGLLNFEQEASMENFNTAFAQWGPAAEQTMKIHGAEDWRQDAFVIRKEISPLVLQIQDRLTELVKSQHDFSVKSSEDLQSQVSSTQVIVMALIMLGMASAAAIGFILIRAIITPIDALKVSAAELAHGKLDQPIDTARKDELGSLAQSFADMRDSIRKKIDDLRVLNLTGERMAAMHEPMKVLEHALKIMRHHTEVEWGSVYLFNKDTQQLEVKAYYPAREDGAVRNARTFKIGEGVAGRAAQSKKVNYIPDTSKDPHFDTLPGDDVTARAIICVPMIDNNEIFGIMNFCGNVGEVVFADSDREFAETIARTAVVSFKNIHMLNVIAEQNRTLEQKVEQRTAELRQKTNDINNMLQNMHQGIFTILPGRNIHPEYSAFLERIVEDKNIANRDVMDVLFNNTDLGSNGLSQITAALDAILGEDAMMFDFNRHCLVHEFSRTFPNGTKILELDWDPLVGESGSVEKLMVTVRDVTELRLLQKEAEKQKEELNIIGQILAVGNEKFTSFIKDANRFLDENEEMILKNTNAAPEVIATLFRNMHTVKGNARTYGFAAITDQAHDAETTYDAARKGSVTTLDKSRMLEQLERVREQVGRYTAIHKEKLAAASSEGVYVDLMLLDKLKSTLDNVNDNDVNALRSVVRTVKSISAAIGTESIPSMLDPIIRSMPDLAQRLGKATPKVVVNDNNIRLASEVGHVMKNVFTHSFRNAVDHGLESAEERKASGKPEQGTIVLSVKEEGGQVVLSLSDDGRGLAVGKLKAKAAEQGLLDAEKSITDQMLAELIFQSGVSTASNVTDISGRGVGMDAIRKFVEKLGGKVEIRFTQVAKRDEDYRSFESRFILPAACAVKVA